MLHRIITFVKRRSLNCKLDQLLGLQLNNAALLAALREEIMSGLSDLQTAVAEQTAGVAAANAALAALAAAGIGDADDAVAALAATVAANNASLAAAVAAASPPAPPPVV